MLSPAFSQHRPFPFTHEQQLARLQTAWEFSADRVAQLRAVLDTIPVDVACVAVSGSLSRMEGHRGSDVDLLVVLDDRNQPFAEDHRRQLHSLVWQRMQESPQLQKLKSPKPTGIFATCASWKSMTNHSMRGVVDEDITTYGQRMQLLLDAQPVHGQSRFDELQRDLLNWNSETRIATLFAEAGCFHWLRQEVLRYWHSICTRANWLHHEAPRRSLEVNLKLRSSRLALITAFLKAIDEAHNATSEPREAVEHLQWQLRYTPLERLTADLTDDARPRTLLTNYQAVWQHIATLPEEAACVPEQIQAALTAIRQETSASLDTCRLVK